MSINELLKAKEEGKRMDWNSCSNADLKKYYKILHKGESRWKVSKEDRKFYDVLAYRGIISDILPEHKYAIDWDLEGFSKEYVSTIIPASDLEDKYKIPEEKRSHICRYIKRAIRDKEIEITKKEYEKAVERRQFLNRTRRYFSPEMENRLFEIASKGEAYMKENQESMIQEVVKDFLKHEKNGDKKQWLKTNKYFSDRYGKITYSRPKRKNGEKICEKPISDKYLTSILSNSKAAKEIQDKRKRLISYLIWFFKIFTPGKHRYHSLK